MSTNPDPVDARLRAHYQGQALDADALARLRASIEEADEDDTAPGAKISPGPSASAFHRRAVLAGAAAVAIVAAGVSVYLLTRNDPIRDAAHEIAKNHAKGRDPEFATTDYAALAARMPRLGFAPVAPERMQPAGLRLEGGRYCSVGGAIAAQLALTDTSGRRYTLYQWRDHTEFDGLGKAMFNVGDAQVTLWREAGLLHGLAGPRR